MDVPALATAEKRSLEDAGRRARYRWLGMVLDEYGADVLATGHTRDDQAETFLLRLVRGAGTRGLAGIHPVAGRVIRPLIDVRRADLVAYLAECGQTFRDDATNADVTIPRNRIRHELLPLMTHRFNPAVADALATAATLAREDDDVLRAKAIESADLIVLRITGGQSRRLAPAEAARLDSTDPLVAAAGSSPPAIEAVEFAAAPLAALPRAVALRVIRLGLTILAPGRPLRFGHVDRVLTLAVEGGRPFSVTGGHARRQADTVVIERGRVRGFENPFEFPLSIPGEVSLEAAGWSVSAEELDGAGATRLVRRDDDGGSLHAAVQASSVQLPLTVRSRRLGDRVRPMGMGGRSRKLQDLLVDWKVPRIQRDGLPIVADAAGRIVWVVGGPPCEDFRVTAPSQGVILLIARRLGGPG